MKLSIYQVDAFTNKLFHGNPAAVIPLEEWLPDQRMQQIATENNLSETAFFVPSSRQGFDFDLRWFTPASEIDLCGHATLASAFIIFNYLQKGRMEISFHCQSGKLILENRSDLIVMDFPSWPPHQENDIPPSLEKALGQSIKAVHRNRDLMVELVSEEAVRDCRPHFSLLQEIGANIIITAPGSGEVDFVSRFFAPHLGINEDPVTGSAHSQLIPFWASRLNKKKMFARQLSERGGDLWCGLWGDRVTIAGQCVFYMKGEISIPD